VLAGGNPGKPASAVKAANDYASDVQYATELSAISTNADYAAYTNMPALLAAAPNDSKKMEIVVKWFGIDDKVKSAKNKADKAKTAKGNSK
jgi:hypothetical protein